GPVPCAASQVAACVARAVPVKARQSSRPFDTTSAGARVRVPGRRTMGSGSFVRAGVAAALLCAAPRAAHAQAAAAPARRAGEVQARRQESDQRRRAFEARLTGLEAKRAAAQGGAPPAAPAPTPTAPVPTAAVPQGAEGAGGPTGSLPVYGSAVTGS